MNHQIHAKSNHFLEKLFNPKSIAVIGAIELKINLSKLPEPLLKSLNDILPTAWSHDNPIDILGDAPACRFEKTLKTVLEAEECEAVLLILVPVAMSSPLQTANKIIALIKKTNKLLLTCWMGKEQVKESRLLFNQHNIPTFETPEEAIQAYFFFQQLQNNQSLAKGKNNLSLEKDHPLSESAFTRITESKKIMKNTFLQNRTILNLIESKENSIKSLKFDFRITPNYRNGY